MSRNDGKIVVIARSEASAERRGNLAKSLSDTGGGIATPAGSQGQTKDGSQGHGGRDCHAGAKI